MMRSASEKKLWVHAPRKSCLNASLAFATSPPRSCINRACKHNDQRRLLLSGCLLCTLVLSFCFAHSCWLLLLHKCAGFLSCKLVLSTIHAHLCRLLFVHSCIGYFLCTLVLATCCAHFYAARVSNIAYSLKGRCLTTADASDVKESPQVPEFWCLALRI